MQAFKLKQITTFPFTLKGAIICNVDLSYLGAGHQEWDMEVCESEFLKNVCMRKK